MGKAPDGKDSHAKHVAGNAEHDICNGVCGIQRLIPRRGVDNLVALKWTCFAPIHCGGKGRRHFDTGFVVWQDEPEAGPLFCSPGD
jgi:hypothetical protein